MDEALATRGEVVLENQQPLPQQIDIDPPESVVYQPMGITARRVGPDAWEMQFLISPLKMVSIRLNAEGKALLLSKLTGGVVIPT